MYLIKHARVAGMLFILALASACATPLQTLSIREKPPDIPPQQELTSTPFYPQLDYYCGPAALAALANYRDIEVQPDDIAPLIYVPDLKGSLQEEVIAATRRFNLLPVQLDGNLESIFREIASGNPVLVLQNLGLDIYPKWHYAIVIGYDLDEETIVLRSGTRERLVRSFSLFERTWQRAGHWSLAIVAPGQVPVTVDAESFLNTLIEFEQTSGSYPAYQGYLSAMKKWPSNVLARIGVGNTAYALGDYQESEDAYSDALQLSPEMAEAWNNLAYALAQQGKIDASLDAITNALKISPDDKNYLDSLNELKQWGVSSN
jgi:tetratricopeptide (TPR) repeat protein